MTKNNTEHLCDECTHYNACVMWALGGSMARENARKCDNFTTTEDSVEYYLGFRKGQERQLDISTLRKAATAVLHGLDVLDLADKPINMSHPRKSTGKFGTWTWTADADPPRCGYYLVTMDGDIVCEDEPFVSICEYEGNGQWKEDIVYAWMPFPDAAQPE